MLSWGLITIGGGRMKTLKRIGLFLVVLLLCGCGDRQSEKENFLKGLYAGWWSGYYQRDTTFLVWQDEKVEEDIWNFCKDRDYCYAFKEIEKAVDGVCMRSMEKVGGYTNEEILDYCVYDKTKPDSSNYKARYLKMLKELEGK